MNEQPEITARTRQALINAFLQLNKDREIQHITVREICVQAHYNRSTFYQYFSDIYDLRNRLETELLEKLTDLFNTNFAKLQAGNHVDIFLKFYSAHAETFLILLGSTGDPAFYHRIKNTVKPIIRRLLALEGDDRKVDYVLEFSVSAMIQTITYWFINEKSISEEQLSHILYTVMTGSIFPLLKKEA